MTERVNLCDFFVYGNVVRCRGDISLAHFLCLFRCRPMIVNLSPLVASSSCCAKTLRAVLCCTAQAASLPVFRVGLSYLPTFRTFCGKWCPHCGLLLSLETFAWIRHVVYISAICNDLLLFLGIFLSPVLETCSIWPKFLSDSCF